MPNFNSTLIAQKAATATGIGNGTVNGDDAGGIILYATTHYTLAGTEIANDTIQLADIPAGAVPIPQLSDVTCPDPGTTLTLDIGDAGDPDRYADGIVLSAGGQIGFCSGTLPAGVGSPYRDNTKATRLIAKVMSADTLTAGAKLTFTIAFRAKA